MEDFILKLNCKIAEIKIKKYLKDYEIYEEFKKLPKIEIIKVEEAE